MIIFVSIISFLLDGILSRYLMGTLFLPLLTLVSIVIIYPYFRNNNYRYLKYLALIGLLYDIVYMNTVFYNFFIFLLLGIVVIIIEYILSNNLYVNCLISVTCIIFYRLINYLFFNIFRNYDITLNELLKSLYSSLLLNIIYCIAIYLITNYYSTKHKILKSK